MGCHVGPLLTDNAVHVTGVPKVTPEDTDPGAARSGPRRNAFNTPQLRDLAATAPYMHNGSLATLRDVVGSTTTGRPRPARADAPGWTISWRTWSRCSGNGASSRTPRARELLM